MHFNYNSLAIYGSELEGRAKNTATIEKVDCGGVSVLHHRIVI